MNKLPTAAYRNPWIWIASGLGSGLSPKAPGTFGSLAALLPYFWLRQHPFWLAVAMPAVFLIGILAARKIRTVIPREDPGLLVLDEWVGQWLTLAPAVWLWPILGLQAWPIWCEMLVGFVLFRTFDILKPWPVSWADRELSGGFGAMFDDALAGVYAAASLTAFALIVRAFSS